MCRQMASQQLYYGYICIFVQTCLTIFHFCADVPLTNQLINCCRRQALVSFVRQHMLGEDQIYYYRAHEIWFSIFLGFSVLRKVHSSTLVVFSSVRGLDCIYYKMNQAIFS